MFLLAIFHRNLVLEVLVLLIKYYRLVTEDGKLFIFK